MPCFSAARCCSMQSGVWHGQTAGISHPFALNRRRKPCQGAALPAPGLHPLTPQVGHDTAGSSGLLLLLLLALRCLQGSFCALRCSCAAGANISTCVGLHEDTQWPTDAVQMTHSCYATCTSRSRSALLLLLFVLPLAACLSAACLGARRVRRSFPSSANPAPGPSSSSLSPSRTW